MEEGTPLAVVAHLASWVTQEVDRLTGDRVQVPLLVAYACAEGLQKFGIQAQVMYGASAWIEILEDHRAVWAGCWGDHVHFWVATQWGEVVDLNASVAHRKRAEGIRALYAPPMLWSEEVPGFYRFLPEGIAEIGALPPRDQRLYDQVLRSIESLPSVSEKHPDALDFPNEPILCSHRRLLDDSLGTFRHFDRALSVQGIPKAPI
jgi:hypothetical protein